MESQVTEELYLAFIKRAFKAEIKGSLEYQSFVELQDMNENPLISVKVLHSLKRELNEPLTDCFVLSQPNKKNLI